MNGKILKSLRQQYGISQDALAKELNISRSAIGMYETSTREANYEVLKSMARFFNVSVDVLVGNEASDEWLPEAIKDDIVMKTYSLNVCKFDDHDKELIVNLLKAIIDTNEKHNKKREE